MLDAWLTQAVSPGGILSFISGIASAFIYHGIIKPWWCRRRGRPSQKISFRITNLIMAVIALSVVWTGIRYTELATEVASCQKEFNKAVIESRKVSVENDNLSIEQRVIIFNWLHDIVFPPPPYSELQPGDPVRQSWGIARTIAANNDFKRSLDRQNQILNNRPPFPDITCGRED